MVLRAEFSLGHSEFNDFLYSVVGEEKTGIRLTVLSAFARIGLDPWREAARLSGLPKEAATHALAKIVQSLPEGDWKAADSLAIADRLMHSMPNGSSPAAGSPQQKYVDKKPSKFQVPAWIFWIAMGVAVYFALSRFDAGQPSLSDRSEGLSQTRNENGIAMVVSSPSFRSGRALTLWLPREHHLSDNSLT